MDRLKSETGVSGQGDARQRAVESGGLVETVRTIFWAVVIAVGFRTFLYEPFNIPSESMLPTLMVGDYLFVSKYSYGYSRHSFPFSFPPFKGRVFENDLERGDVAVFKLPRDNKTDYIKRIVGLPGDRLQMIDSVLHINGTPVKRERIADAAIPDQWGNIRRFHQYRETLPNGVTYNTLDIGLRMPDNTGVFLVPAGHYFAMGDNRDNSSDSRVPTSGVGFIPAENIVGRAEVLFFSTDGSARKWAFWNWIGAARFERFFKSLR
ncbi:MAG: signal peptidase I [Sphingomonadales bacterium]